ncbi:MAG: hypothetical protein ACE37K_25970 [Planctomycetota bacterium]
MEETRQDPSHTRQQTPSPIVDLPGGSYTLAVPPPSVEITKIKTVIPGSIRITLKGRKGPAGQQFALPGSSLTAVVTDVNGVMFGGSADAEAMAMLIAVFNAVAPGGSVDHDVDVALASTTGMIDLSVQHTQAIDGTFVAVNPEGHYLGIYTLSYPPFQPAHQLG